MPLHNNHQIEEIHYSLHRELNEFYWAIAIRTFAVGLLGIFIPIYVYIYFDYSITHALVFYAIQQGVLGLVVPFTSRYFIKKLGIKKMMALANPFLSLYLVCLVLAQNYGMTLIFIALVLGISYMSLYWPAYHIDFAKFSQGKKRGRQIGTTQIIIALAKAGAPFLGGFVIVEFGFTALFILAAIIITLSSIPLFFSPEVYEDYTLSWKQNMRRLFARKNRRATLAFVARGVESAIALIVFPVFIYLVIRDFETIGSITSLTLVIALVFTYLIGWLSDKRGSESVLNFASVAHAFAWLINAFIATPIQYILYSSFLKFTQVANQIPFASLFYGRAKHRGHGLDEYVVFFETVNNLSKSIILLIVALGFALGFDSWLAYFSLAALAALSYQFVVKRDKSLLARIKK